MDTKGKLFIVGLPIGHAEDISLRALRILSQVDIIVAEDTRSFKKLYNQHQALVTHLNSQTSSNSSHQQITSYHKYNEARQTPFLLKALQSKKDIALVSEAGTPHISDPGYKIITQCYQEGISLIPIPGASALTAALSISPFRSEHHYFMGFPPKKVKERDQLFQTLSLYNCSLVAFESPHRLSEHLKSAQKYFSNRSICIQRELTKPFEEINLYDNFEDCQLHQKSRGEFVIIYSSPQQRNLNEEEMKKNIYQLIEQNKSSKEIAKQLSSQSKLNRSEVYKLTEELKKKSRVE